MKFVSRRKEFRLIIRPTEVIMDESRRPRILQGEKVEFKQGVYVTNDRSLIDYLIHHPLYGKDFTSEIGNDPVQIEKYSMVFDDGAELTGAKIVAGFPEKNRQKEVEMIMGAQSTVDSPIRPVITVIPPIGENKQIISKEAVEALIDNKLDAFLEKIGVIITPTKSSLEESTKIVPKIKNEHKKFKCPICKEEFKSGFAVGTHKKKDHS